MPASTPSPRDILAKLVAFDTTSSKSNLSIIDYIESFLAGHGVDSRRVPSPDGAKACLYATIGPRETSGIGLSGHTDCVPVTGQAWDTDPFTLVERDGRLYARGAADMKGFLACMMASVPRFKAQPLRQPIHLLFSYDEEVGCLGVRPMIAEFDKALQRPRIVIVGEPTSMTVVDAHKGANRFLTKVTGLDAHSSMPQLGVNAIKVAARLVGELGRIEADLNRRHSDPRFEPSYSTVGVGLIEGGTAPNIVPRTCSFSWDVRALPGLDARSIMAELMIFAERECLPAMREVFPQSSIETTPVNLLPAFAASRQSEAVTLAMRLANQNETYTVAYGTEAGLFDAGGSGSVICGPGDIAQAHKPNEFIAVSELDKCMAFLGRVADAAAA
ncbi:MAG: acetylornithine deacetylase [Hyphomicrobiaceae bacterium]|nr:MAG: acetylornithine deacetylase [Hyphomicrobiaceae bacterium]